MDSKTLAKEAFLLLREGQLDGALEQYLRIKEKAPEEVSIAILIGDIYADQYRFQQALRAYQESIHALYRQQGSEQRVEVVKNKMSRLDPDSVDTVLPALSEAEKSKQQDPGLKQSVEKLKALIASDPKNFENYQKLGDLLAQNHRRNEAAEQYLVIGNALYNNRMFKKAGAVFQRIIQMDPNCLPARIALGEIYAKEGSDSDAKKEYLYAAGAFIRQGNVERGQQFAQKAIQLKSIEAHYYLGLVFLLNQDRAAAQQEFETLLKFKVNHTAGLRQLARVLVDAGQLDEAYKLYERLVKKDAKNPDAYEKMGRINQKQNNVQSALGNYIHAMDAFAANEEWERAAVNAYAATRLDANNQELFLKLADASYNAGLIEQAAEACVALGDLFDAQGKTKEAAGVRAKARELTGAGPAPKPKEAEKPAAPAKPTPAQAPKAVPAAVPTANETQVMLNMADTYVQQGSLDEAIDIYQKILKTDPNNEKVKNALTRVYAMFAGINPETAVARKNVPTPQMSKVDEKEHQRVQKEARERALREAQVRVQRNVAAESVPTKAARQEDEMMQNIGNARGDEIAGENQDEFMTVTVAEIYTKQGLLNEALKIYQKILEIEPGNMEAQVKKQELEKKMAEQEKLRKETTKTVEQAKAAKTPGQDPGSADHQKSPDKTQAAPDQEAGKDASHKGDDKQEPPAKGHRGRVSYV
ncbi:tetratricopeptide repeat protein [candidate division FCPU426 bacterium]|nr:tetratricopeptide repeat protein [candidate division FCPU426 bacterium]